MKLKTLWIVLAFSPVLSADPYATCNAGATSIPVFSTSSASGEVGDYTLDCTGTSAPAGQPTPEIEVDAILNVPILTPGSWTLVDGGTDIPGTLKTAYDVEFLGVPFGLPGGSENFTIEGIFVNPSAYGSGFEFKETDSITFDASVLINDADQEVGVNATPEPSMLLLAAVGLGAVWLAPKTRKV